MPTVSAMTWLPLVSRGSRDLDRILSASSGIGAGFAAMYDALWESKIDPTLLEIGRLRVAQLLGCEAELAVRQEAARRDLDEEKISQLREWPSSPRYSVRERACLGYVERIVADPHGLTDAEVEATRAHISEAEFAILTVSVLYFEAFARVSLLLGVEPRQEIRRGLTALFAEE